MSFTLVLALFLNILNPAINQAVIDFPSKTGDESIGISVTAKSALIVDEKSDKILFSKNKDKIIPIASITKLVTTLVLLDQNLDWKKNIQIEKEDHREGGRVYLDSGETVTVRDLFNLALVASDNQAITALVRASGLKEEEFVFLMNQKSLELGMNKSVFFDPTGLDPRNVSNSQDLVKLAKAVFSQEELIEILSKKEYSFQEFKKKKFLRVFSTNKLFDVLDGKDSKYLLLAGKTGYLDEAGYCFLSKFKNFSGDEIIVVILGSKSNKSRFQETKGLVWWAFNNWQWGW